MALVSCLMSDDRTVIMICRLSFVVCLRLLCVVDLGSDPNVSDSLIYSFFLVVISSSSRRMERDSRLSSLVVRKEIVTMKMLS